MGVVAADGLGAGLTSLPLVLSAIDLLDPDRRSSDGDVAYAVIIPVFSILFLTYASSTIYGVLARRRCERMQEQAVTRANEENRPPRPPERADVVGTRPLHCAITTTDVSRCFFDEPACAEETKRTAGTCEARTTGWCFDMQGFVDRSTETTCGPTRIACDALRSMFASDRTMSVSTCGRYTVKDAGGTPPPSAPPITAPPSNAPPPDASPIDAWPAGATGP